MVSKGGRTPRRQTRTPRGARDAKGRVPNGKRVDQTKIRDKQVRVQDSAAQVQAAQRRLEARMARERHTPTMGAAAGAQFAELTRQMLAPREVVAPSPAPPPSASVLLRMPVDRPWFGEPKPGLSVWAARAQLREGYRVEHVIAVTGVGMQYLVDIPLDDDGRGVRGAAVEQIEHSGRE